MQFFTLLLLVALLNCLILSQKQIIVLENDKTTCKAAMNLALIDFRNSTSRVITKGKIEPFFIEISPNSPPIIDFSLDLFDNQSARWNNFVVGPLQHCQMTVPLFGNHGFNSLSPQCNENNRIDYPSLYKIRIPNENIIIAMLAFIKNVGTWQQVTVISDISQQMVQLADFFMEQAIASNISISSRHFYAEKTNLKGQIYTNLSLVVAHFVQGQEKSSRLLCHLFNLGVAAPLHVFVSPFFNHQQSIDREICSERILKLQNKISFKIDIAYEPIDKSNIDFEKSTSRFQMENDYHLRYLCYDAMKAALTSRKMDNVSSFHSLRTGHLTSYTSKGIIDHEPMFVYQWKSLKWQRVISIEMKNNNESDWKNLDNYKISMVGNRSSLVKFKSSLLPPLSSVEILEQVQRWFIFPTIVSLASIQSVIQIATLLHRKNYWKYSKILITISCLVLNGAAVASAWYPSQLVCTIKGFLGTFGISSINAQLFLQQQIITKVLQESYASFLKGLKPIEKQIDKILKEELRKKIRNRIDNEKLAVTERFKKLVDKHKILSTMFLKRQIILLVGSICMAGVCSAVLAIIFVFFPAKTVSILSELDLNIEQNSLFRSEVEICDYEEPSEAFIAVVAALEVMLLLFCIASSLVNVQPTVLFNGKALAVLIKNKITAIASMFMTIFVVLSHIVIPPEYINLTSGITSLLLLIHSTTTSLVMLAPNVMIKRIVRKLTGSSALKYIGSNQIFKEIKAVSLASKRVFQITKWFVPPAEVSLAKTNVQVAHIEGTTDRPDERQEGIQPPQVELDEIQRPIERLEEIQPPVEGQEENQQKY